MRTEPLYYCYVGGCISKNRKHNDIWFYNADDNRIITDKQYCNPGFFDEYYIIPVLGDDRASLIRLLIEIDYRLKVNKSNIPVDRNRSFPKHYHKLFSDNIVTDEDFKWFGMNVLGFQFREYDIKYNRKSRIKGRFSPIQCNRLNKPCSVMGAETNTLTTYQSCILKLIEKIVDKYYPDLNKKTFTLYDILQ